MGKLNPKTGVSTIPQIGGAQPYNRGRMGNNCLGFENRGLEIEGLLTIRVFQS
jgi:hypothetical protein